MLKISGLIYLPEFITEFQEKYVVQEIDKNPWSNELKRRVQHYGYKYDYTKKNINASMRVDPLCPWMKVYANKLKNYFEEIPDQAIINEYLPGQGIARHIDCQPCFKKTIASLSLLSSCILEFTSKKDQTKHELLLEPRSLLILSGEARYEWFHGIPARKEDHGIQRQRRISVTFRNVILNE